MDKVSGRLTVFFEEPFWIGVFERISEGKLSVCKVTFGAEPKDYEVYDFVLRNYYRLKFSPAVATDVKETGRNPKRIRREVRKQVQNTGIGTKSQQALQLPMVPGAEVEGYNGRCADGVADERSGEDHAHIHHHSIGRHAVLSGEMQQLQVIEHTHQAHGDVAHKL